MRYTGVECIRALMQNEKDHMQVYARLSGLLLQHSHVVIASSPTPGSPASSSPRIMRNYNIAGSRSVARTRSGKLIVYNNTSSHGAAAGGFSQPSCPRTNFLHKLTIVLLTFFLRRSRILLLAPFVYITCILLYIGGSAMELPRFQARPLPGSYYRSDEVFTNLWPAMQHANTSTYYGAGSRVLKEDWTGHGRQVLEAWEYPKQGAGFRPCVHHLHHDSTEGLPESNGYILVVANGGLNQQRSTICNAVAVAKLMNSTLIIPHFHFNSVWKDPSVFGDIFDEDHFIFSLAQQVRILRELPKEVISRFENISMIPRVKVRAWSLPRFYLETALPVLKEHRVIRFTPFANRLAYDGIPKMIQKLRCFTNFEALRFASPIAATGQLLVKRMAAKSTNTNGNYVAIHLRYEQDMVAFSRCVYEGDYEEKVILDNARERGWRGKFNRTGRVQQAPEEIRRDGKCPLTPVEVGMMLRGMGFRNTTPIYLAAGKIFNEEESMEPLRRMFPYLETKRTLLSPEEYAPFEGYSSRLAAIDYTVCLYSEVFVTTQGGNFPQIMMGHRRFLNKGHSKTINPDKRSLVKLLDNPQITWEDFAGQLQEMLRHIDSKGLAFRKLLPVTKAQLFQNPKASLYTCPVPECMCPENSNSIEVQLQRSQ